MEFKNINEVNEYYKKLGIKSCWDLESLTIEELNIIANKFDKLHKIYPDVVVEEIGDYYSFDKTSRIEVIRNAKRQLETKACAKHEFYIKNPELLGKAEDNLRMLIERFDHVEVKVNDEKYDKMSAAATYMVSDRSIKINHIHSYRANEITCHEFGHAVAYQYNLNKDVDINEIFNSTDKETIELLVSEYATTSIEEFIAEIFMRYYISCAILNSLVVDVMEIIIKKVAAGKAMSEIERMMDNIYKFRS